MEKTMQLSEETLALLSNFASINPNIVLKPGQEIKTISEAKNILATASVVEDFPQDVGVYDLNEFLNVLSLVENPTIDFAEKSVKVSGTGAGVNYYLAEPSILTTPERDITMPNAEVTVELTEEKLLKAKKAASVLGHLDIAFVGTPDEVSIKVFDPKDASANTFELSLGDNPSGETFSFIMNISNLKIIDGDYDVQISSKLISKWTNKTKPVNYYIALEKSSSFGV
jgi:hypothetical protein